MTFPAVAATNSGNSGANATSHAINMPASVAVGDQLIVVFANDGTATVSVGSGTDWNQKSTGALGFVRLTIYEKIATGSGDNLTLNTSASEGSAHVSLRITGAHATTDIAASTQTGVTGSTIMGFNSLNPADWDAEDTLWIAAGGWDGNIAHSSYPANYTSNQVTNRWANSNGVGVAVATREVNASSEDPGDGAVASSSNEVRGITLAVRPAAVGGATPKGPLGNVFAGPFGGAI